MSDDYDRAAGHTPGGTHDRPPPRRCGRGGGAALMNAAILLAFAYLTAATARREGK